MKIKGILLAVLIFTISLNLLAKDQVHIQLKPEAGLMTETIQKAINSCAEKGNGTVVFTSGTYLCGGIELKSGVKLQFKKDAILQGSDKYADYNNDAFIFGKDLSDIAIQGPGIIDGVDCINKKGEEGFRGPHCIRLINCKNISLEDFTIKNSANWAINCRHCSFGKVDKVLIRGGHDGLHTRFCDNFTVTNCDFRTGDDAFAGNDNRDFMVTNCKVNTSCNGFRMGCRNFTVKHCQIWGPGESVHKIQKRNNMLSAFVHFSPKDENPKLESGNWLIEDVTVENVDQFYVYNYKDGLWQTGQPVTNVSFKNIKATGLLGAFNMIGDSLRKFNLIVKNSSFSFREGADYKGEKFEGAKLLSPALFNASSFDRIELRKVTFSKRGAAPVMKCIFGNSTSLDRVSFISNNPSEPFKLEKIGNTKISNNKFIQAETK
ncbi:MAG: glycosyl hydrolase family 28-related protein [Bacteroidia bacterium]